MLPPENLRPFGLPPLPAFSFPPRDKKSKGRFALHFGLSDLSSFCSLFALAAPVVKSIVDFFPPALPFGNMANLPYPNPESTGFFKKFDFSFSATRRFPNRKEQESNLIQIHERRKHFFEVF